MLQLYWGANRGLRIYDGYVTQVFMLSTPSHLFSLKHSNREKLYAQVLKRSRLARDEAHGWNDESYLLQCKPVSDSSYAIFVANWPPRLVVH
jgi:hypothetical protein